MYKYLREDIKQLKAYEVNEQEYDIKLDANEGPEWLEGMNRYPDDTCSALRLKLAEKLDKQPDEILFGNGSSELIDLVMRAYLEYGEKVVTLAPAFSMYKLYTIINKGVYKEYPLDDMQRLDVENFIKFLDEEKPKIVILCNPNNPTGSVIPREDVRKIVEACDGMVILDEAYVEFSDLGLEDDTRTYQNLIVLRTFSKAYGLAAIRLGYMIADAEVIAYVHRVRAPYNINTLSQRMALKALESEELFEENLEATIKERKRVEKALKELGFKTFPSQTNFIFFSAYDELAKDLADRKILIRSYSGNLQGYFRLSIGTKEENDRVLEGVKEVLNEKGDD